MGGHKFSPEKLERLNDPKRLELLDLEGLIRDLDLEQAEVFVEVGAGTGLFSEALLKRLPQAHCHALDLLPLMVEWMRDHRETAASGRLRPATMEESHTGLSDAMADAVLLISLHHELEHPVELLKDCRRVLKAGGKLFVADWDKHGSEEGPPMQHRLDAESILADLRAAGFADAHPLALSAAMVCFGASKTRDP